MTMRKSSDKLNRDPVTGTLGAHPVATGIGAAMGAAGVGVAGGAIAGPIGAAVGAALGGVAGGLAGKTVGEEIEPTSEAEFWRENYELMPYYSADISYDDLAPAYRYGWESASRYPNDKFEHVESTLQKDWIETEHDVQIGWEIARNAVRDAWEHARQP